MPLFNTMTGSKIEVVVLVVVVPDTDKLPDTVKLFATVTDASDPVIVKTVVFDSASLTLKIMFPSVVTFLIVKLAQTVSW